MDAYPGDYVAHNVPFVILSGLGSRISSSEDLPETLFQDGGIKIQSKLPPVTGPGAEQLLASFLDADRHNSHLSAATSLEKPYFAFKVIGRDIILPARKAKPPAGLTTSSSVSTTAAFSGRSSSLPILHSPISPLSFGSPTYPDGILTSLWATKHQRLLPAAFVSFYSLLRDPDQPIGGDDSLEREICETKQAFESSGQRTKFIVVLLGDDLPHDGGLEERFTHIRRAAGLDSKSFFYIAALDTLLSEDKGLVANILSTLHTTCMDYYRDLSKHARRKKNRAVIPPPTLPPTSGTSQILSAQGWGARYDFKLGIFAEFRRDLDAAGRNYESAYEGLLSPDVFEAIASWSPRFNEARMLADVIAIRILRCLLWTRQTTSAARSWGNHRARLRELVDRKGKGSSNYGWEAWEATWARVMAELVQGANLSIFEVPSSSLSFRDKPDAVLEIFSGPEKGISWSDVLPFEHLHHSGYWMKLSAARLGLRKLLAEKIPKEDRLPPQSPMSKASRTTFTYDDYLCNEPHVEATLSGCGGVDHSALILDALGQCLPEFSKRHQVRAAEEIQFSMARELLLQENYEPAHQILKPLYSRMSWRQEGWWEMVLEVGLMLQKCAKRVGDSESIIIPEFELCHRVFDLTSVAADFRPNVSLCLKGMPPEPRPVISIGSRDIVSFMSTAFAFACAEGHVGEPLCSQLTIHSSANPKTPSIVLSEIIVNFLGGIKAFRIRHRAEEGRDQCQMNTSANAIDVVLSPQDHGKIYTQRASSSVQAPLCFYGHADLTLGPGETKVLEMKSFLREAGTVSASSIILCLCEENFQVNHVFSLEERYGPMLWWTKGLAGLTSKAIMRSNPGVVKILPRPPKMELRVDGLHGEFYTDESIVVGISVLNEEEEDAEVALEVRLLGRSGVVPGFSWLASQTPEIESESKPALSSLELPLHRIGRLSASASAIEKIEIAPFCDPGEYVFEIKVVYRLVSNLETPISKILPTSFTVSRPFEANYDFMPRIHPGPWPNYFAGDGGLMGSVESSVHQSNGLVQRWHLAAKVASFAKQALFIEGSDLADIGTGGQASVCSISTLGPAIASTSVKPGGFLVCEFVADVAERSLEDRRSQFLDFELKIYWKRSQCDGEENCTALAVPRMQIPFGEPRVIVTARPTFAPTPLIHVEYTIENPSMHFLTFTATMEASEEFAFSGPKTSTVQLVPISRSTIKYRIFPFINRGWIRPRLHVVDRYFNKLLKMSGNEGVRSDKGGLLVATGIGDSMH
ncbi:hypothetical protein L228DRAFT_242755 [Xylona heveae TC161]|uniref:Uncharacterized protein n=1 Tax=Xylona heveae (strain CBS 132557 / TC161) TaxID=1328760 RepID=A0A165JIZ6_XYLHT|nr:hypothetical protein L228DRAFT_242755 [Xylona heveae TC161]KZF26302.1 hypothetical protein L228DRAFT_242755 [Xylona heveae TC161]